MVNIQKWIPCVSIIDTDYRIVGVSEPWWWTKLYLVNCCSTSTVMPVWDHSELILWSASDMAIKFVPDVRRIRVRWFWRQTNDINVLLIMRKAQSAWSYITLPKRKARFIWCMKLNTSVAKTVSHNWQH